MNDSPINILFVDDERRLLDGLRRQLRNKRSEWTMRFADSGNAAIKLLEESPADVVVSDMRMPGMNGADLLRIIQKQWPSTIRFILSGQTDQTEMLHNIGAIHQFLQKPCETQVIEQSVTRSSQLAAAVESRELRAIVGKIRSLPVLNSTYRDLTKALDNTEIEVNAVAKIVDQDIALSTKILQMVNSAFFGLPRSITSSSEAIKLIGLQNLRVLVLSSRIFDAIALKSPADECIAQLWRICADLGASAAALGRQQGASSSVCDRARLAGNLSLAGRALIAGMMPERFDKVRRNAATNEITLDEAEQQEFGVSQEIVGAYALGLWAFDESVVDAVAYQTNPCQSTPKETPSPATFVHMARCMYPAKPLVEPTAPDHAWIGKVGITNWTPAERRGAA